MLPHASGSQTYRQTYRHTDNASNKLTRARGWFSEKQCFTLQKQPTNRPTVKIFREGSGRNHQKKSWTINPIQISKNPKRCTDRKFLKVWLFTAPGKLAPHPEDLVAVNVPAQGGVYNEQRTVYCVLCT